MCKWHNSKRAVLHRLRSNPQSLADPESSQSAPAILSRLRSSPSSLVQPKISQPASALGLCRSRVADFDALAVAGVVRMTGHHCLRMREIILKNNRKWILVGSQLSRII